jgi:hypothetical protein
MDAACKRIRKRSGMDIAEPLSEVPELRAAFVRALRVHALALSVRQKE